MQMRCYWRGSEHRKNFCCPDHASGRTIWLPWENDSKNREIVRSEMETAASFVEATVGGLEGVSARSTGYLTAIGPYMRNNTQAIAIKMEIPSNSFHLSMDQLKGKRMHCWIKLWSSENQRICWFQWILNYTEQVGKGSYAESWDSKIATSQSTKMRIGSVCSEMLGD